MNAYLHSEISKKRRGGVIEDYYSIHDFMDSTKNLCSDNRHRILHTMWGINYVVIPIFGHTITNSNNKNINVKDLCEQDHILPDYQNKFIPTLSDFVNAIDIEMNNEFKTKLNNCFSIYKHDKKITEILLSPLSITGHLKSLLLTHNSWFLNFILPKIMKKNIELRDFEISTSDLFENMQFQLWMDNGSDYPKSFHKIINSNLTI